MREEIILKKYAEMKKSYNVAMRDTGCSGTPCYLPPTCGDSCSDGGGGGE